MISYVRCLEATAPVHVLRARVYALLGEWHLARASGQGIEEFVSVLDARRDLSADTLTAVVGKLASAIDVQLALKERRSELTPHERDGLAEAALCLFLDAADAIGVEVMA